MKYGLVLVCVFLVCVNLNEGKDFTFGTRANNLLISTEKVKYRNLPLIRRDKEYSYKDPKERIIKNFDIACGFWRLLPSLHGKYRNSSDLKLANPNPKRLEE